jgi:SAM-dependent methyltransferase
MICISNIYNQDDAMMNGKQRNFYLNYLKEHYPNDWALCLDADEVVEDLDKIKEFIQTANPGLYSVKMRHFQEDLGHEDATQQTHYVLNRLFKIDEADCYPEVEHPVLKGESRGVTDCTTIWHLAHITHCFNIKNRYEKNMKHSNIHSPEFLDWWKDSHMFGTYPSKQVNPIEIPDVILNYFHIDKDKYYFANRGIEIKHPIMVQQWNEYFKPESVLDLGCGRGCYLYFWKWFVGQSYGIELSDWAVKNNFLGYKEHSNFIKVGDISKEDSWYKREWDLITIIDVLEHLDDKQLDKTLSNIVNCGKKFLFSIPFEGDPNLLADKTHKQFHNKQWWFDKISSYGIIIKYTPKDWLFSQQQLIGFKNDK